MNRDERIEQLTKLKNEAEERGDRYQVIYWEEMIAANERRNLIENIEQNYKVLYQWAVKKMMEDSADEKFIEGFKVMTEETHKILKVLSK